MQIRNDEDLKLLSIMLDKFDPASALWRTIEVRQTLETLSKVKIDGPILDLGCGEGNISSIVFKNKGADIIGLDNWQTELAQAKYLNFYRQVVLADATMMPFLGGSFNAVFSNSVLEHIKELDKVLKGVAHILKPKGLFIFTVPTDKFGEYLFFYKIFQAVGLKRLAKWYMQKRIILLSHHHLLSEKEWVAKLNNLGFKVICTQNYLSESVISAWDLIAATGFMLRKFRLDFVTLKAKRIFHYILSKILMRYYSEENVSGHSSAGLLIVANLP